MKNKSDGGTTEPVMKPTTIESLEKENQRLRNDLLDALDLKEGKGPTALTMLSNEIKRLKSKPSPVIGERSAEEVIERHFGKSNVPDKTIWVKIIESYASQFKPKPSTLQDHLIQFLQDRIREAYRAIESGMGSQRVPFDEVGPEGLKGMKSAYGDVLMEIRKQEQKQ